jgi:hypothetical protein
MVLAAKSCWFLKNYRRTLGSSADFDQAYLSIDQLALTPPNAADVLPKMMQALIRPPIKVGRPFGMAFWSRWARPLMRSKAYKSRQAKAAWLAEGSRRQASQSVAGSQLVVVVPPLFRRSSRVNSLTNKSI